MQQAKKQEVNFDNRKLLIKIKVLSSRVKHCWAF